MLLNFFHDHFCPGAVQPPQAIIQLALARLKVLVKLWLAALQILDIDGRFPQFTFLYKKTGNPCRMPRWCPALYQKAQRRVNADAAYDTQAVKINESFDGEMLADKPPEGLCIVGFHKIPGSQE
ncbi:hypothetical protein SDC9_203324 [bioreactor metagenome]|uniref:Uncharacterized protein n=1 Tax=bioreactor metagenome TaxID=1076179 RepID=A0A645IXM3_9ZZZZ